MTTDSATLGSDTLEAVVVTQLADDELFCGHVLTSVAGWGPELEVNIALSSMGQDELGHARLYYELLVGADRLAVNALIYDRAPEAFAATGLASVYSLEWEILLAKQYLYETADQARRSLLRTLPMPELSPMLDRMDAEEEFHVEFWRTWLSRTTRAGDQVRERVQSSLASLWPLGLDLFAADGPLGQVAPTAALERARDGWRATCDEDLTAAGLSVPHASEPAGHDVAADRARILDELGAVYRTMRADE